MLYVSISRGFKPGGFNPVPGATDTFTRIYKAETTTAAEIGARFASTDGMMAGSVAAFATDYRNFQYFAFINGNDTTFSVPSVDIRGVEAAVTARPNETFSIDASFAYTDAEIGRLQTPDPVSGTGLRTYTGNQTPNSPRFNGLAGAELKFPVTGEMSFKVRGEVTLRGKTFFEIDNALYSPTEGAINLRAALATETWSIAAWAKNLTDNRWAVSAFGQGQIGLLAFLGPNGPFDSFNINRGRQYGVTVKAEF